MYRLFLVIFALCLCTVAVLHAQTVQPAQQLTPSDAPLGGGAGFASDLDISGDYLIVGAGDGNGAAYIFKHDGTAWEEQAKLVASNAGEIETFGATVSIDGDYALVTARGDLSGGINPHMAYFFKRNGEAWEEQARLPVSDRGASVSIDRTSLRGDYAAIGVGGERERAGAVYVFKRNGETWEEQTKLYASDTPEGENVRFGHDVVLAGDVLVVSAFLDDDFGTNSGSAYVFVRNGDLWEEQAKLLASDGAEGDWFGSSVALSEDALFVGARDVDERTGAVYIFDHNGSAWEEQTRLVASDRKEGDRFGNAVAVSGDYLLVGAFADDSAYIFKHNGETWVELAKLKPDDPIEESAAFGNSVAISDKHLVVGYDGADAVYVYDLSTIPTGITHEDGETLPLSFHLDQNYPNPFNPTTTIRFALPRAGHATLKVYSALGREVATLVDQPLAPDAYTVTWDARGLPSGVYLYRLQAGAYSQSRRLTLLK